MAKEKIIGTKRICSKCDKLKVIYRTKPLLCGSCMVLTSEVILTRNNQNMCVYIPAELRKEGINASFVKEYVKDKYNQAMDDIKLNPRKWLDSIVVPEQTTEEKKISLFKRGNSNAKYRR